MAEQKRWYSGMLTTEDWWSFWLGLFFVALGIIAAATRIDLTGWIVWFPKWANISNSLVADHSNLMSGISSLILSYIVFTIATGIGAKAMNMDMKKYFLAWTLIFWITAILFILSRNAYIQATSIERTDLGINWSLSIGGAHYIIALLVGLIIGNLSPQKFRQFIRTAAKPEWFIKIAIVCLGVKLGMKAIEATSFAMELLIAGCCATVAAYMLFWPLTYALCRRVFNTTREWAACLASGASICGVSAAIATGGAIRARPIVPVMVSGIVVVFALVELIALPPILTYSPWFNEPIAAGASLGLTVKTDGADAAAGEIADVLMRTRSIEEFGVEWEEGWITSSAIMTKIWIDMFIGVWALVLTMLWLFYVEKRPDEKVEKMQIWWRFPKFVVGYFTAWIAVTLLGLTVMSPEAMNWGLHPVESPMRKLFFMLTFTSIGLETDFRRLAEEGMGRMALVKAVSMVLIVIPIGWILAYVFFNGMTPIVK